MKKISLIVLICFMLFVGFLIWNAANFKPNHTEIEPIQKVAVPVGAADRMAEAVSIRTVSFEDKADFDSTQFELFNRFLERSYPSVFANTEHTLVNDYSHLFKWSGKDNSLKPIILMGHIDVVPIASPAVWSVHPFTEGVKNDTLYGRGTIDDKVSVIGLFESAEQLINEGYEPNRTIYFAFGHDEEVSGLQGAVPIVDYLKAQNVKAEFVLDEGGAITTGLVPGVKENTALIGIAEKGYLSLELSINMVGGHSSQPAKETSIDVLSSAISKLKNNLPARKITPALAAFMDEVGPYMDFKSRLVFANRSLFNSILLNEYEKSKQGNASIRTTTSPTIFEAGIKENVIPTVARAVVNFRIIPGETVESVIDHVTSTINDERISIEIKGKGYDPSPISPMDNLAYQTISRSIKEINPNIITAPNLVIGATDSRHFVELTNNIYRFTPIHLSPKNMNCFHGVDERISVSEFKDGIRFYRQVILNSSGI